MLVRGAARMHARTEAPSASLTPPPPTGRLNEKPGKISARGRISRQQQQHLFHPSAASCSTFDPTCPRGTAERTGSPGQTGAPRLHVAGAGLRFLSPFSICI